MNRKFCAGLLYGLLLSIWSTVTLSESMTKKDSAHSLPVLEFRKDKDGFYTNVPDKEYLHYMWESFVALSRPAVNGYRDDTDVKANQPGSRYPLVWETFAQPPQVFLPSTRWSNYPQWKNLEVLPAGLTLDEAAKLCVGFSHQTDIILFDINQPNISISSGPVAPLMDQHRRYVRYQVAMNKRLFEYLRENRYYDAATQQAAVRVSEQAQYLQNVIAPYAGFKALPFDQDGKPGMLEIKSAWRVLDPIYDHADRYFARPGYILSPNRKSCQRAPAGLGLVALHIHRLTRLSHVAATFEQIDNVDILDPHAAQNLRPSFNPGTSNTTQSNLWPPYGNLGFQGSLPPIISTKSKLAARELRQPNNISRATPIPGGVRLVNQSFQSQYSGTPLEYYQLINTQHVKSNCRMRETDIFNAPQQWRPSDCPTPNTQTLINAALESYTQLVNPFTKQNYNYSCQDCHAHARPCGFVIENKPELTFKPEFMVMSYLLSKAKFPGQKSTPDNYSCNNPATQPPLN